MSLNLLQSEGVLGKEPVRMLGGTKQASHITFHF